MTFSTQTIFYLSNTKSYVIYQSSFLVSCSILARKVFHADDDLLYKYNFDDGKRVEPEWYCPIIPMVLVNGADGIGTGWSTKVHNYDIREIVRNLLRMIDGEEPREMVSSLKIQQLRAPAHIRKILQK